MDKQERLQELLKKVPDTYSDFEICVAHFAHKFGYEDRMIEYLEKHPEASTSEVAVFEMKVEDELGIPDDDIEGYEDEQVELPEFPE